MKRIQALILSAFIILPCVICAREQVYSEMIYSDLDSLKGIKKVGICSVIGLRYEESINKKDDGSVLAGLIEKKILMKMIKPYLEKNNFEAVEITDKNISPVCADLIYSVTLIKRKSGWIISNPEIRLKKCADEADRKAKRASFAVWMGRGRDVIAGDRDIMQKVLETYYGLTDKFLKDAGQGK